MLARCLFGLLILTGAAGLAAAEREVLRKNFLGEQPPEIVAATSEWLGDVPPTTLEQLRGNVVWLQFNF